MDNMTHTPAITDLAVATPAEIDTELARIYTEILRTKSSLAYAEKALTRPALPYIIERNQANVAELTAKLEALEIEEHPLHKEFIRRGGWLRYFLVKNANGHVHREMNCSTCFPTTEYGWLTDLSDCDEDAMIEEWGELACTVCFPSAPANPAYNRPSRRDAEAQAARQAEKAARQAAKDAKAIYGPDGGPLRILTGETRNRRDGSTYEDYEEFKTKVAARNALSQAVKYLAFYGNADRYGYQIKQLVEALAATDIDTDKVIANALKNAVKEGCGSTFVATAVLNKIKKELV